MKWLIKQYMAAQHIESISELAKLSGLSRRLIYDRINDPKTIKIYELIALDEILHFSNEDLLFLLRGEKHELSGNNIARLRIS